MIIEVVRLLFLFDRKFLFARKSHERLFIFARITSCFMIQYGGLKCFDYSGADSGACILGIYFASSVRTVDFIEELKSGLGC